MINLVVLAIDHNKTPAGNSRLWNDTKRFQLTLNQISLVAANNKISSITILHNFLSEKFRHNNDSINYIESNGESILKSITDTIDSNVLIMSSYFVFNKFAISSLNPRQSSLILLDKKGQRDDIYTIIHNNEIKSLSYSLSFEKDRVLPFGRISYYCGKNYSKLCELSNIKRYENLEEYEVINKIIESGLKFNAVLNKNIEIKQLKDVKKTNSISYK